MPKSKAYDYVIIGSGFGGTFAAYELSRAGKEVLIIERGVWVKRDDSCWDEYRLHLGAPMYRGQTPAIVNQEKDKEDLVWTDDTVGGMSTFYGAAAIRMRESDFLGAPLPDTTNKNKGSRWPIDYKTLEPYYDVVEKLQNVAGSIGEDITAPPMKKDYPQRLPDELPRPSRIIKKSAEKMGLHPFQIPLAINFSDKKRQLCVLCQTCDHYLCKIEAKNDLAVVVLPDALKRGARILDNTRAVKINLANNKVVSVDVVDQATGAAGTIKTKNLIVSGGALASPHLLLASGIDKCSDGGGLIGKYLMRHCSAVVNGALCVNTNPEKKFQKRIAIPDYYYGDPKGKRKPLGNWGMIQDVSYIGKGVIKHYAPWGLKNVGVILADHSINQLCIAEDMPVITNKAYLDWNSKDKFGMPSLKVYHRYTKRDLEALNALVRVAKIILLKSGAFAFYTLPVKTFSHVCGTTKFGKNKSSSALDPDCRVWGIKNLYVLDASFMPSGGSVNPSLTIAANSLRVAKMLAT